jgi:putative CocE/NonD family hydrolase
MDPIADTLDIDCFSIAGGMGDRREIEKRQDVLVYATEPLETDIELTGPIVAQLFAVSSVPDTDFTVTLVDVFEDGFANLIQDGIIRTSYRESYIKPSLIKPGCVYAYDIDLWATSYVVKKGHRIRLEVSSSCFDRYDRNPNTGEPFGKSTKTACATQKIYHTQGYQSNITLPIIPRL